MEIKIEAPWKVRSSLENVINKKLMKLVTFNDRLIRREMYHAFRGPTSSSLDPVLEGLRQTAYASRFRPLDRSQEPS